MRRELVPLLWLAFPACLIAGEIELPSDVSIALTAEPNSDLKPGQRITLSLTASNLGVAPVTGLVAGSSPIFDELDLGTGVVVECDGRFGVAVVDLENSFYFVYRWTVTAPDLDPLAAGETRSCQIEVDYTVWAPVVFPLTFDTTIFTDDNPANNSATVTLLGAVAAPTPVPMLQQGGMVALLVVLAALGTMAARRSRMPGSM